MLSPEFVVLFHLKTNNHKIESLRSIGIHPQKAKNAIKNLIDIWMINELPDWIYWINEDILDTNIDLVQEIIDLKRKFNQLKVFINHKINADIGYYKDIDKLII